VPMPSIAPYLSTLGDGTGQEGLTFLEKPFHVFHV
jgi:hypothetical protein